MQNKIRYIVIFFAAINMFIYLGSCSEDTPNESGNESKFDFSGDLIAFRSDRDGALDIWLMTPDGAN
jgi:hypothetical protein